MFGRGDGPRYTKYLTIHVFAAPNQIWLHADQHLELLKNISHKRRFGKRDV